MILQNVITTLYVGSFRFWYLFFNIGLSPIQVYNEITQNFEVFLVAAGAVASTWGCYSSLSSLRWHPLLKFKPWHHFPPLKLTPKRVQIPQSSSSRRSKWRRPLRLNSNKPHDSHLAKPQKFSFSLTANDSSSHKLLALL